MARFTFRLNTVLNLALAQRDRCRVELADTAARARVVERGIADLDREIRALADLQPSRPGAVDVGRLLSQDRYGAVLRENRAERVHQQKALADEMDSRRALLVAADREVRMLETLRNKQAAKFAAEESAREQRALDEIGARNGRGPEGS